MINTFKKLSCLNTFKETTLLFECEYLKSFNTDILQPPSKIMGKNDIDCFRDYKMRCFGVTESCWEPNIHMIIKFFWFISSNSKMRKWEINIESWDLIFKLQKHTSILQIKDANKTWNKLVWQKYHLQANACCSSKCCMLNKLVNLAELPQGNRGSHPLIYFLAFPFLKSWFAIYFMLPFIACFSRH